MLHILFLILKIIGIVLLIILGIVLFAVIHFLFAPAYYKVEAETPGGLTQLNASAKAHWFLHLATAYISYRDKEVKWQVRLLGKIWNNEKKETTSDTEEPIQLEEENSEENLDMQQEVPKHENEYKEQVSQIRKQKKKQKKESLFQKIKYTIQTICDKLKSLWETKEKIADFLNDEKHKMTFAKCKKEIAVLVKRIRPRTIKGRVRFGFEDPYNTGRVLAILSVLYPFYGDRIQIEPDFESKVLEGDIQAKGHIRGIHLLIIVCNLLFDQNIRNTYKDFKSLK